MSEQNILNERVAWDDDIQDSIGPDYGFPRKRSNSRVFVKPPGGKPVSRETQNSGHSFQLSWLKRSFACVQRIERWYEQYEDGYFTLIDHDAARPGGEGRHYVGRFIGDLARTQVGNDNYEIRDLTFECVPGAPMLRYPNDWEGDSIALPAFSDSGRQYLATVGTWIAGAAGDDATMENAGTAGEFATMEYRGYGFQLWMQQGLGYGQVQVFLDGTLLQVVDLYSADLAGPQSVLTQEAVPLDLHRVKVLVLGTKNAAATAAAVSWCKLQVMR